VPTTLPSDVQVSTYVSSDLRERIDATATAAGLSRASWVRSTIVAALATDKGDVK
jgi:hypothetical protein